MPNILDQIVNKNSFGQPVVQKTQPSILDRIASKNVPDNSEPVEFSSSLKPNLDISLNEQNTLKDQDILQSELDASINSFRRGIDQTQISNYQGKLDAYQETIDNNVDKQNSWLASHNRGLIDKAKLDEELAKIQKQNLEAQKEIDSFNEDIETNRGEMKDEFVSKLYQIKEAAVQAKGGDAGLWESIKYTAPSTIGSSASLMGQQLAATFGTGLIKKLATNLTAGAIGGPVGEAAAVVSTIGTTIGLLANSRYQETMAEIGGQLEGNQQKLVEEWLQANPGQEPDEEVMRQIRMQARKGKDEMFNQQMMLVIPDAIEALIMPGSKVLGAFKTGRAAEQTIKGITDYNKYTRAAKLTGKIYAGYLGEKFEEGYQYATGKRQASEALGLNEYDNQGFIKDLLSDSSDVLKSLSYGPSGTLQGKDGRYSDDKEFQFAEQSGGLLAILPGSVSGGAQLFKDINTYRTTNKELQNSGIANPEDKWFRLKDQIYAKHFDNNTMEYLLEGVRNLGKQTNDKGLPFLNANEVASETQNIKTAFDKYLEVSKHIESVNPELKFGLQLSPEQKIKITALRNELFHTSMQLTRHKDKIQTIESLNNINDLVEKQEDLVNKIKNTVDNSTIKKTYNIDTRTKIAEAKLEQLKTKREELLKESGLTLKTLPGISSIEESNKNQQYLIDDLNLSEINQNYNNLLKVKDNKTLNIWFDNKFKKEEELKAELTPVDVKEPLKTEETGTPDSSNQSYEEALAKLKEEEEDAYQTVQLNVAEEEQEEAFKNIKEHFIAERAKLEATKAKTVLNDTTKTIEETQDILVKDQKRFEAEKNAEIEALKQRASKQKELEDSLNSVKDLKEISELSRVKYKGKEGKISKHPEENVYQFIDDNTGKIYDIPQDSENGYDGKLYDYGIFELPKENPISDLIDIYEVNGQQSIVIDGKEYINNFSNPLSAINRDKDGNILSISLETKDGRKRNFKKFAEEIAYSILLHTYNKLENESSRTREETKSKIENNPSKQESEGKKPYINERDSEESKKIEEAIANLEKGIKESQALLVENLDNAFKKVEEKVKIEKIKEKLATDPSVIPVVETDLNENPTVINTTVIDDDNTDGKKASDVLKTNGGTDNNTKLSEDIYFRTAESIQLDGHKLLVVTKETDPELYAEILAQDPTAQAFEAKNKDFKGIWTLLVDKDGKFVLSGGKYVQATLETAARVESGAIEVDRGLVGEAKVKAKQDAIKKINALRSSINGLKKGETRYLPINGKSKGLVEETDENANIIHSAFENKLPDGSRPSFSVIGRIFKSGTYFKKIPLEIVTLGNLFNGVKVLPGKLYTIGDNGRIFDLIPRNINNEEIGTIVKLIELKLNDTKNELDFNPIDEIKKIISFKKSDSNPEFQIYINSDNRLVFGNTEIELQELPSRIQELESFLQTKKVNANNLYMKQTFYKPSLDGKGEKIDYKEYLLSGETPMFGTDLKPELNSQGKINRRFIQTYFTYDNNLVETKLPVNSEKAKTMGELLIARAQAEETNDTKGYIEAKEAIAKLESEEPSTKKKFERKSSKDRNLSKNNRIDNKDIDDKINNC